MAITGGCLCGSVRYQVAAAPLVTRVCWCRVCQYIGAGNATVNAVFPLDAVAIKGEVRAFHSIADSGNRMQRRFCPSCGTHLFSQSEARPQLIVVRVGTFDEPDRAKPAMNIWTASAPSWALIDRDLPCVEHQPPPTG